jgi:hypothetical protein
MSQAKPIRRTRSQWAELIEQWRASGQSARDFCRAQGLGYASFCQWRRRLEPAEAEPGDSGQGFVDLSALSASGGRWDIVLSLGDGVELRLSRG